MDTDVNNFIFKGTEICFPVTCFEGINMSVKPSLTIVPWEVVGSMLNTHKRLTYLNAKSLCWLHLLASRIPEF